MYRLKIGTVAVQNALRSDPIRAVDKWIGSSPRPKLQSTKP